MQINSYVLELDKWIVKNDGTDAVNTTKGINNALEWASQQGFTEVVLPKGIYLIDENNSIKPKSYMTFNLNGSTLRVRDNKLTTYNIVLYDQNQQYCRITNGIIEGDRYTHDYNSVIGTHEFGVGINIKYGASYVTVDNLEIRNCTGDGVLLITSYSSQPGYIYDLTQPGTFEVGGLNLTNGTLTTATNRIRTAIKIPVNKQYQIQYGYFGLFGDSYGGIGTQITTDYYEVVFYNADDKFNSSISDVHIWDTIPIPKGAAYCKVALHQGTVPTTHSLTCRLPVFPTFIYIEKCHFHHSRRLGVAVCGAKNVYIRDCDIHDHKGIAPAGGIDIEDGYDLNQYIYIEGNNIYRNGSYNIIAVAGRHIFISENRISHGIFTINGGVNDCIITNNFFIDCGPRMEGQALFSNNMVIGSRLLIIDSSSKITVENSNFYNSALSLGKNTPYTILVNNCHFNYDADYYNAVNQASPLSFSIEPHTISNCTFEGYGIEAFIAAPSGTHDWILTNNIFKNIKHPSNKITRLPAGRYEGCRFINTGRLTIIDGGKYNFVNCDFLWDSSTLFYVGGTKSETKFQNCTFTNNGDDLLMFSNGDWGILEFSSNTIEYPTAMNNGNIIEFYTGVSADLILFQRNKFISNKTKIGVKADKVSDTTKLRFEDNILKTVTYKVKDTHIAKDNFFL